MTELSLHILDIVQNSIRAKASFVEVIVEENESNDLYSIEINDNGVGVDEEVLAQITDPFYTSRTTRKVGMGISLLKQNAEQTGGSFQLNSKKGKGTLLKTFFKFSHIDRPIMGDIAGTMTLLIGANPDIRFIYVHRTELSDFEFDTKEVNEELEGIPINHPDILKALKELINNNLEMIEARLN